METDQRTHQQPSSNPAVLECNNVEGCFHIGCCLYEELSLKDNF